MIGDQEMLEIVSRVLVEADPESRAEIIEEIRKAEGGLPPKLLEDIEKVIQSFSDEETEQWKDLESFLGKT
jgi:hypothetical protein